MDLEQLQQEAEKDLKIDKEQLDIESLRTPESLWKISKNIHSLELVIKTSRRRIQKTSKT